MKIGVEGIAKIGEAKLSSDAITFAKKIEKLDRKSTRLNSSHIPLSRMPSSA